jgi:hypothetical protein
MSSDTVTKKDLKNIAYVFDPFHLGVILRELSEIFDSDVEYTLRELLELAGEMIYSKRKAVYVSQQEYDGFAPEYKEKRHMPKVGDKYEFLPYKEFKYGRFIAPFFYSALTCKGVKKQPVIRMVTEKIFADHDYWFNPISHRLSYWETCKSEEDKETATYLYNHYLRMKVGIGEN